MFAVGVGDAFLLPGLRNVLFSKLIMITHLLLHKVFPCFILQEKSQLIADLDTQKASFDMYKTEVERLTSQIHEVNAQLRDAKKESERTKQELDEILRTAKLDRESENAIGQLHDQLKSLQQQVIWFN